MKDYPLRRNIGYCECGHSEDVHDDSWRFVYGKCQTCECPKYEFMENRSS